MSTGSKQAQALAERLIRDREEIIELWSQRVHHSRVHTRPLPVVELVDHLPEFLSQLAEVLRRGWPEDAEEFDAGAVTTAVAREHGMQRFRHGFDVRAIVMEYTILLDVLFEYFAGPEQRIERHLARVLLYTMSSGVADAVEQFSTERDLAAQTAHTALLQAREYEQQLIGVVSHDLRNPLAIILNCTDLALRCQELGAPVMRSLRRLKSNAERALRLIGDLLDFTQARVTGQMPIRPENGDMQALVAAAVEEAVLTHPARTIERTGLTAPMPGTWDHDRIAQVLTNLLDNALKFSPSDTVVRVEAHADGEQVMVNVHNWGRPIAPDRLHSVFEPFQRADPTVSARVSLGLGLHISRQIALAHGGRLEVASTTASGTTFTLTLPQVSAEGEERSAGSD